MYARLNVNFIQFIRPLAGPKVDTAYLVDYLTTLVYVTISLIGIIKLEAAQVVVLRTLHIMINQMSNVGSLYPCGVLCYACLIAVIKSSF